MTGPPTVEQLPEAPLAFTLTDATSTASWRTFRPVIGLEKCTRCGVCWKFCPDVAIEVAPDGTPSVVLSHCKGCGICAHECPKDAIAMVKEDA